MAGLEKLPNREEIEAFVKKHKIAVGVGVVVLLLMAMSDGGGSQVPNGGGGDAPMYDGGSGGGGGGPVYDGGGGGGGGQVDMDQWREDQRRDDRAQRDRIDSIREVERCYDPETGTTVEVSIHVGC